MKKLTFIVCCLLSMVCAPASAQTQTIRLFCAADKCSELTFRVAGEGTVHVYWGEDTEGDYSHGMLAGKCLKDTVVITMPSTITGFDCEGYCLSWLDVNGAPNLVSLNCADNELEALNIDSLVNLDELRCSDNSIVSLSTSRNANLRYLDCDNNKLTSLDLSANGKLEVLSCSGNDIGRLSLGANDYLRGLWASDSKVQALDLSLQRNINSVVVSQSALESINFSSPTALQDLWLDHNSLKTINLSGTDALVNINVSDNQMESIEFGTYSAKTKVSLFDCSNNRLPFSSFYPYTKVDTYVCGIQEPVYCGFDSLVINELIDCSDLITNVAGNKIGVISIFDASTDAELEKGSNTKDYQYLIGRVRFWHEVDSVYMYITCTKYPDLEIRTTNFVVYDPENLTGIEELRNGESSRVNAKSTNSKYIYDLQGRKFSSPNYQLPKGVYIREGKKTLY